MMIIVVCCLSYDVFFAVGWDEKNQSCFCLFEFSFLSFELLEQ